MQNPIRDAFDIDRIQVRIQDAFESVRADQPLIDRTRQRLTEACQPDLKTRIDIERGRQQRFRRQLAAAVSIFVLACVIMAGMVVVNTPIAAISIDLDQSVIMEVNRLNRVVAVTVHGAANGQGQGSGAASSVTPVSHSLMESLKRQTLEDAVGRLIAAVASAPDSAIDESGATIITLATSANTLGLQVDLGKRLEAAAEQALADSGRQAVLYMEYTGYDRVQEARRLDMTPGRLNLIQKLVALAPDTQISDCNGMDNMAIMQLVVDRIQASTRSNGQPDKAGKAGDKPAEPSSGASGQGAHGQASPANGNAQTPDATGANSTTATGQTGAANSQGKGNGPDSSASGSANANGDGNGGSPGGNGSGIDNRSNGNANATGNGNGNGNGNGSGNGGKSLQNGSGQADSKPAVDDASLQRIRQALARSAENARRKNNR